MQEIYMQDTNKKVNLKVEKCRTIFRENIAK